jgi:eukaryotic-like serine/threonine-protein kinase
MSTTSGSRDYGRFDELAEEFAGRFRRGERPSLQEYVDRLPEMAEEIREMFPAMVEVERADGDVRGEMVPPSPPAFPHGGQIGDYRILREVGRGGMGVVYEAEQVSLGRRVALKVLPGHVTGDRQALERFRREAKSAARLHHTNIVPVFEVGRDRDVSFYAMQLIQGQGLDQVFEELRRLRVPGGKANGHGAARSEGLEAVATNDLPRVGATSILQKRALVQMTGRLLTGRLAADGPEVSGRGEDAAHVLAQTERFDPAATSGLASDVPKRELPPAPSASGVSSSAVMPGGKHVSEVDTSGRRQPFFRSVAQIGRQTAQGLAYAHARGIVHRDIKPSNLLLDTEGVVWITDFGLAKADDDGMTASGDILGTLRYMAPERFRGEGDARADIYALGLTLYELLTLRSAYETSDRLRMIEKIKNEEPARPRLVDPQIPRDLETIVLKAIDKHPEHRYPTAVALAEDLRRFLADEPIKARQISTSERYWRWARRNPVIAALGGVLSAVLVMATIASLLMAARFANLADDASNSAAAEHGARIEADGARTTAVEASKTAETARAAALAETYRAMLSEVKALRASRQLGWRVEALAEISRMAVMPTPRRDLAELRTEAVATIGEFGMEEVARFEVSGKIAYTLDFSPDSRTLVTASDAGNLDLWDIPERKHSGQLLGVSRMGAGGNRVLVRFLPDNELVFLSSSNQIAFLQASGRPSARLPIDRAPAKAMKLGLDRGGRRLAVGWSDGRIDLHDAATGALQRSFAWEKPWDFAFSPDGRWLALQSHGGPVQLVSTSGDRPTFFVGRTSGLFGALAFNPDGETIAGVDGRNVVIWSLNSKRELLALSGHKEEVTAIAFSPDGSLIATTCGDSMIRIWDARDGRVLSVLPGPWYMRRLAFSPDGQYLAASADPGPVCLYQIRGRDEQRRLVGHEFGTLSLAFHPRLTRVASSSDDATVIVWDTAIARSLHRWVADHGKKGLAFSPDGSYIACSTGRNHKDPTLVRLLDAEDGTERRRLSGHRFEVSALAFDPKGDRLATGDENGTVILWDVESGRILRREVVGRSPVASVVFIDGGRHLLVGLEQGEIGLFDLERADPPRRVRLPDGCRKLVVDDLANRATIGDSKGSLIALSLPDLEVVHRLPRGHDEAIVSLALSPDGRLLASSGMDRRVVLRDASTFQALATFPAWTGVVRDLAFDATGRRLGFAGSDSDLCLWDLGMVHGELAALGLAWGQPAPPVLSTADLASTGERPRPPVPVIRPGDFDPAEIESVQRLIQDGIAASQQGRFAAAAAALQRANDRFLPLRRYRPGDLQLARLHGMSLGLLADSLRGLKRPDEALARFRESLAVYESLGNPGPGDLYNMACACAMVSALDGRGSPEGREKLEARALEYLRRAIAGNTAQILPLVATDHDLDPLRRRADFRDMMADASFPSDPFTQPSPITISLLKPEERKIRGEALIAAGRTLEAIPLLSAALERNPRDNGLLLRLAALQAWFHRDAELAATCARAYESARDTSDPVVADCVAKSCSLRPPDDPAYRAATLSLARSAVELGKGHDAITWFRMGLGIAEYRAGHDETAAETLRALIGHGDQQISVTSAFYLAMTLSRQGKDAEARRIATEAISRMRPLPLDEDNPLAGGANHDDLILWLAYKEARALLKLDADPDSKARPKGQ